MKSITQPPTPYTEQDTVIPSILAAQYKDLATELVKRLDIDLLYSLGETLQEKVYEYLLKQNLPKLVLQAFNTGKILSYFSLKMEAGIFSEDESGDLFEAFLTGLEINRAWGGRFFQLCEPNPNPLFYETTERQA